MGSYRWLFLLMVTVVVGQDQCEDGGSITFELVTGYVYSAPSDILDTLPGTLRLADCLDTCRANTSCHSVNFETGLCVMFSTSAEQKPEGLALSQYPVFTMYSHKTCLRGLGSCRNRPWSFEVVYDHHLRGFHKKSRRVASRKSCMEVCLQERAFPCRSATFDPDTGDCSLSHMDRLTTASSNAFLEKKGLQYLESTCVDDPLKMCDFQLLENRLLKTVDALHESVASMEDCRQLCLDAPFRCRTYDYQQEGVCRLSHHAAATLQHVEAPYENLPGSSSYELGACYNVSIDCRATDMVARVHTNRIFDGKLYAKARPNSCVMDVQNSLDFELRLGYNDLNCDVKQDAPGSFSSDVIIQHHDQVVTSQDIGLAVRCYFALENRSISNGLELQVSGKIHTTATESAVVASPNVTMRITDRLGNDISTAQVGDPLSLWFEITDRNSPYEMFVRELVAMDGLDNSEILLIDSLGCPTDVTIMGPVLKVADSGRTLQAPFDAFKFPSSSVVQFQALVTPCLPSCEPIQCDVEDYFGQVRRTDSYGRRKRQATDKENVVVMQSIRIADRFKFDPQIAAKEDGSDATSAPMSSTCHNLVGLVVAGVMFLLAQLVLALAFAYILQRRRLAAKTRLGADSPISPYFSKRFLTHFIQDISHRSPPIK